MPPDACSHGACFLLYDPHQDLVIIPESIAELCRHEGINPNVYYKWSKEFLEAGKKRLMGDTQREATSGEVLKLRKENSHLKHLVADLSLKNDVFKKSQGGSETELDEG